MGGTRVAMMGIIKQITSRIDVKYSKEIEQKENLYKAKECVMDDSDTSGDDDDDDGQMDVVMDKQQMKQTDVNGNHVQNKKKKTENEVLHPIDDNDTNEFLEMLD